MRKPEKSKTSAWWRVRTRLARDLIRDEAGGVLVYMTILIPVMMGIIGLAVDASRLFILNTEQKDLADAAALAGAWELDGEFVNAGDNALVRAEAAARNIVTNDPRWGSDTEPAAEIVSVRFCETLIGTPPDLACDEYLDDPTDQLHSMRAHFIEVITEERQVFPSFLVAVGAVSQPRSDAVAIAGTSLVACNVMSLMICNPFENDGEPFSAEEGQMFVFKAKQDPTGESGGGGTSSPQSFAPGDFGLVDHPDHPAPNGANATRDLLSLQSRSICIHSRVNPHQGHEVQKVNQGINVRFDEKTFNCAPGNCFADMTSAPHVLRGTTQACDSNQPMVYNPDYQYPLDTTFTPQGSVDVGNGTMDAGKKNTYWAYHHGDGATWPLDVETRYQAYQRELEMLADNVWGRDPPNENPEGGVCLTQSTHGAERRIINAAIIDCLKWGVKGNSVNNIRADLYAEFFITHPSKEGTIYTEFVRLMTPDEDDSKLKRIVQLYR